MTHPKKLGTLIQILGKISRHFGFFYGTLVLEHHEMFQNKRISSLVGDGISGSPSSCQRFSCRMTWSSSRKDFSMQSPTINGASAPVVARPLIPAQGHGRRFARRKAKMLAALASVIDAGARNGKYVQGANVAALERRITESWGVAAAFAVNSGSSALRLSLETLDIAAGREVIMPALTFIATAYAASDAGLIPVFVDIDPKTFTIDPAAMRAAITEKTAAIIPVYLYGQMADMQPIMEIADAHGLFMIEDAAQAHGARYRIANQLHYAGSMGDLGCFSLNGIKNMGGLGDGGLITVSERFLTRFPDAMTHLRGLRDLGRIGRQRYTHETWGWRARMDEFTALECLLELDELEQWNDRRRAIAARYASALANTPFQAPLAAPGREHAYFAYPVLAPSTSLRANFEQALTEADVEIVDTYTLVSGQRLYRDGRFSCRAMPLPIAHDVVGRITHLPIYPELEDEEVERIIAVVRQWA
jgi:dTDP-4-amino-4,6-dideoxygalactose transaminase